MFLYIFYYYKYKKDKCISAFCFSNSLISASIHELIKWVIQKSDVIYERFFNLKSPYFIYGNRIKFSTTFFQVMKNCDFLFFFTGNLINKLTLKISRLKKIVLKIKSTFDIGKNEISNQLKMKT